MRGIGGPLLSTSDYTAALQAKLSDASTQAQAELAAQTGVNLNQQRVSQGASSAISLAQNGYNPASDSDNANLVHAIAGGLCLVPGVGPILGAAVEGLWLVGNQVACPLENAFSSIGFGSPSPACGGKVCTTSGNWSVASILSTLSGLHALPKMPKGSFAAFVVPVLAYGAAQNANCKGSAPPATLVDAAVAIWNKSHAGPAVAYLVPALLTSPGGVAPSAMIFAGAGSNVSGSTASAKAGQVANIFYAFGPVQNATAEGLAYKEGAITFWPWNLPSPPGQGQVPGRIVWVNVGAPTPVAAPHVLTMHLGNVPFHLPVAAVTPAALAPKPTRSGAVVATVGLVAVAAVGAALVKTGAVRLPAKISRFLR